MGYPKRLALQLTVQLIRKDRKGRVSRLLSVNPGRDPLIETIKSLDAIFRWFAHLSGLSFGRGKGLGENPRLLELQRSKYFYGRRMSGCRMNTLSAIVYVIDDDPSIRQRIKHLSGSVGLETIFFEAAKEFLANRLPTVPSCMVLEVRLRGTSGLDLQDGLNEAGVHTPLIFLTSHGDIPMAVRAMKAGAVTFLTKPYRDQDLLDSVQEALVRDEARRHQEAELSELRERFESLTPRERDVLPLVTSGLPSKKIAAMIGTSVTTVKVHRSKLTRKIGALCRRAGENGHETRYCRAISKATVRRWIPKHDAATLLCNCL